MRLLDTAAAIAHASSATAGNASFQHGATWTPMLQTILLMVFNLLAHRVEPITYVQSTGKVSFDQVDH